ncbi:MAG TPA: DUF6152 family protein [Gammaproteobacteria bacterium]
MTQSIKLSKTLFALGSCLLPVAISAHHATAPTFDQSRVIEIEGEITEVHWQNPHIRFRMQAADAADAEFWDIETNSVSIVSRFGLSAGLIEPGTQVRVAGNPGRRVDNALWLTNVLLGDGREILFGANYPPRWSEVTLGAEDVRGAITADLTGSLGIFRVWTSLGGGSALWNESYPLTPEAAAVRAGFNPITDAPTLNCVPKGMPLIMEQPYPMEIVDEGDEIVMHLEEYDTVRRVAMADGVQAQARNRSSSLLGNSVGRWEDGVLVVDTTDIDYLHFDKTGIRQSAAVRTEERFTLSDDGSRLDYQMTVTDPATFTEPVVLTKAWVYRPNDEVRPYDCTISE